MAMYREQNAEHKHNREMANQGFEDVAKFKHLGVKMWQSSNIWGRH
jgi:hypothetical protein